MLQFVRGLHQKEMQICSCEGDKLGCTQWNQHSGYMLMEDPQSGSQEPSRVMELFQGGIYSGDIHFLSGG